MASRTVVHGVAGHLLRRRRCGASQLSNLLRRHVHVTSAEATREGSSALLPDELIDVKPRVVPVAPSEQVSRTRSEVVTVVPEYAAKGTYWTPDPATGVFAPDDENSAVDDYWSAGISPRAAADADAGGVEPSVLEQTAWIRELQIEEAEKPHLSLNKN